MNDKSKLLKELEGLKLSSNSKSFYLKLLTSMIISIIILINIGQIIYGKNSIDVLSNIRMNKKIMQNRVKYIQIENAKLQKQYFDALQLKPE